MKSGSVLEIQLVDVHGAPLAIPNISVDAVLYAGGKERYRFNGGVTDARGRLSISYDMLELTRQKNQAFALMDYNTRLEDCDDIIGLWVPTLDQLRERLAAVARWFPENESALAQVVKDSKNGTVVSSGIKRIVTDGSRIAVQLPVS